MRKILPWLWLLCLSACDVTQAELASTKAPALRSGLLLDGERETFLQNGWLAIRDYQDRIPEEKRFSEADFRVIRESEELGQGVLNKAKISKGTVSDHVVSPMIAATPKLKDKVESFYMDFEALGNALRGDAEPSLGVDVIGADIPNYFTGYEGVGEGDPVAFRPNIHVDYGDQYVLRMRFAAEGPNAFLHGPAPGRFRPFHEHGGTFHNILVEPKSAGAISEEEITGMLDGYRAERGAQSLPDEQEAALDVVRQDFWGWYEETEVPLPEGSLVIWSGILRASFYPDLAPTAHNFVPDNYYRMLLVMDMAYDSSVRETACQQ